MHIKEKEEVLVEMQKPVSLKERTRDHVKIYFQNTQDEEIKRMLPSVVKTEEEALRAFEETQKPVSYTHLASLNGRIRMRKSFFYSCGCEYRKLH